MRSLMVITSPVILYEFIIGANIISFGPKSSPFVLSLSEKEEITLKDAPPGTPIPPQDAHDPAPLLMSPETATHSHVLGWDAAHSWRD